MFTDHDPNGHDIKLFVKFMLQMDITSKIKSIVELIILEWAEDWLFIKICAAREKLYLLQTPVLFWESVKYFSVKTELEWDI